MTRGKRRERERTGVTTALIYTRVSSDEQAREGLSLPAQVETCGRYCADRGWVIGNDAQAYQDVLTGKRDDRPQYQALLSEARRLAGEGQPVAVVVMRLDRFGRRLMERVRVREELKQLGIATHSVKEGEVDDRLAGLYAWLAEEEIERLGSRIRDTREHVERSGWHMPGRPAWGYRYRRATDAERAAGAPKSVLVPHTKESPYVTRAFAMVASGEATPRGVAQWALSLPDEARGGRRLNNSSILLVLAAPVYAGRFEDGSKGKWKALVDEQSWNAVQTRLGRGRGRSGPASGEHLLTGLLSCPACGAGMGGWTVDGRWKRYRCNAFMQGDREKAARGCNETASARSLDADTLAQVSALLAPLAGGELHPRITRAWERLRKPDDAQARERARTLARARKDSEDARRRIASATRRLVDGDISQTAYAALASEEQSRLEVAERVLAASETATATPELPSLADVLALLGDWQTALTPGRPVPAQRSVLRLLIERVVPERIGHGKYTADVKWAPLGQMLRSATRQAA